jgi:hypothetical protein
MFMFIVSQRLGQGVTLLCRPGWLLWSPRKYFGANELTWSTDCAIVDNLNELSSLVVEIG